MILSFLPVLSSGALALLHLFGCNTKRVLEPFLPRRFGYVLGDIT